MGKLNKENLLKGVQDIINEGFSQEQYLFDGTDKFDIHKYVNELLEEGHKNPELMTYLLRYDNALKQGVKDFMVFEQFGQGLTTFSKANKAVKNVISKMNETLKNDGSALVGYLLIENISNEDLKNDVLIAFNSYIGDKCADTRDNVLEAIEPLLMVNDPVGIKLNLLLTEDSSLSPNFIHSTFINEDEENEFNKRLQDQRDKRKADEIFEKVKRYIDEQITDDEKAKLTEKEEYCLNAIANHQGLNLLEHINNIRYTDAKSNERLMEVLDLYSNAINQGAYEERLYETFLHNISKFNYLSSVDKAIKNLNEKVNSKLEEITLTKILEEMKDDHTSFIYVDLIQEDVARYVKEPNATNRIQLRNALMPYASDPYINEMFNIIYADNTKRANELTEKALNIKDQINIIRENATIENIYTPVQYIDEETCIFNVNGQFYVKKNNNLSILDEKYIDKLDEKFIELSQLINDPHITINEDNIVLVGHNNKYAIIYEGYVDLCGHKESQESLRNLREMCMKYDDYDTNFYIMCSCLLENFNNIAKINWAKHITLNENNNINADIFKLNEHIFIATHDDSIGKHTFYRNVNPIFCKNKLNEHMGINVSSLFEELLPSQDKIILKLNETKNAYEKSIEDYEDIIDKMKSALDNASDENKKELEDAIKDATDKLKDVKDEYKEWQKEADKLTGDDEKSDDDQDDDQDDDTVIKEKPNEPMSDEEVENSKDELSTPLEQSASLTDDSEEYNEENAEVSDEEFSSFLNSDDEDIDSEDNYNMDSDDDMDSEEDMNSDDEEDMDSDEEEDMNSDDEEDIDSDEEDMDSEEDMNSDDEEDIDSDDEEDIDSDDDYNIDDEDDIEDPEEFKQISFRDETDNDEDMDSDEEDIYETPDEEDNKDEYNETEDEPEETDLFGGNVKDPMGYEAKAELDVDNAPKTKDNNTYEPNYSYKIADVMFDENLKTGIKEKSGSVIVIIPMVDGTGKKYTENKTIQFYLSANNTPILDNEPMTNELYSAIVNAITSHPDFETVSQQAEEANENNTTVAPYEYGEYTVDSDDNWEDEYLRDGNDEDRGNYSINGDEDEYDDYYESPDEIDTEETEENPAEQEYSEVETEETEETEENPTDQEYSEETEIDDDDDDNDILFGFKKQFVKDDDDDDDDEEDDDEEDEDNVVIPTYKSGDTEIELPAATKDDTIIPESFKSKSNKKSLKESIKIKPIFKKNKKNFF